MHGLSYRTGISRCMQAARFIEHQAALDPTVAEITADILTHNANLRNQIAAAEAAEDALLIARANRRWKEDVLRNAIRVVGHGIVGQMNGRRSPSFFLVLFPEGYGGMARLTGDKLVEAATELNNLLDATTEDAVQTVMAASGTQFKEALAEAQAAVAALNEAETNASSAKAELGRVKVEWVDAYFSAQRSIEARFARDRARAEVYFIKFRKSGKSALEDDTSTEDELGDTSGDAAEPASEDLANVANA